MRQSFVQRLALTVVVALLSVLGFCAGSQAALTGGCSKVDITPPLGITLIGSKGQPSDAVMDELHAKAMVVSDGVTTVAIVSVDLLYAPLEEITNRVREIVSEKTGIPVPNIMVCATHTHSGPEVFTRSKLAASTRVPVSDLAQSYLQVLVRKIADAACIAHQNMQEVRIGAAKGHLSEVLYNRRFIMADGQARMNFSVSPEVAATQRIETSGDGRTRAVFTLAKEESQPAFGPIDPDLLVLRMEDAEGRIVGSLIDFGCHPVCIYPHLSTSVSADYPAFATRVVEQIEGGTCLFMLGLAGNTVPLQRGPVHCERIGKAVGGEALKRMQSITCTGEAVLTAISRELVLPTKQVASSGEADDEEPAGRIVTEIQALRLGDIYLLGLPGEILVEVGLAIKEKAGIETLFIATVANDAIGYVPHSRAYDEGGYEPTGATRLAKGAGEIMVEQALALLRDIRQTNGSPN